MKTNDFTEKVEALGYEVSYNWGTVYIRRAGFTILDLGYLYEWEIDTDYPGFEEMLWNDKKELMTIVSEYMLTDPIDREEEKRYYLQLSVSLLKDNEFYLQRIKSKGTYTVGSHIVNKNFDVIFTESEIAEMDITGFEKIEVTEC